MTKPIQSLSLYDLDDELSQVEQALFESGGAITEKMESSYADLLEMKADKITGYVHMIRKFEASVIGIKNERKRLQNAERTLDNAAKSLKSRLCASMVYRGESEYQTPIGKVKLQQSGARPVVLKTKRPQDLPAMYQRITVTADLEALKAHLTSPEESERFCAEKWAGLGSKSHFIRIY